ncbi:DUF3379 family protein [Thalassotalea mangrovi]|uniref:DUF3379 domain-containing protein n=1 Tax=Thalassotalea mangrovi TaxID=2572245 RepID=A0A4U1B4I5_9GAMM|nr:DUF3379 family protein [Thalassotalea mangrovi]TKB45183.1 DUF3379 domain-containing protein [Thalassotalea mangrovi]
MDELEFRRRLYANPKDPGADIRKSMAGHPANEKFFNDINQFEKRLDSALHVSVPDNLASNLILRQTLDSHRQQSKKRRWHLAVAASVAFAVGIGVQYFTASPVYSSTADYSLAHYYHEQGKFDDSDGEGITLATLNDKSSDMNVRFKDDIGSIIAVKDCYFDGMDSLHLVIRGQYDNVTIFVIPKVKHLSNTPQFADSKVHGLTRQFKQGDVIILGDKRESLGQWQQKIDDTIEWSI